MVYSEKAILKENEISAQDLAIGNRITVVTSLRINIKISRAEVQEVGYIELKNN